MIVTIDTTIIGLHQYLRDEEEFDDVPFTSSISGLYITSSLIMKCESGSSTLRRKIWPDNESELFLILCTKSVQQQVRAFQLNSINNFGQKNRQRNCILVFS